MLKTRLIPVLLLMNGVLVRSRTFSFHQVIGNPVHEAARYSEWNVDELIYIDITREGGYDLGRDDVNLESYDNILDILRLVSRQCFVPLTFGGGIRTMDDVRARIENGADKVTVNSMAITEPDFIAEAAGRFGSQAVVVSIDAKRHAEGEYEVFTGFGRNATGLDPSELARRVEAAGAGEIIIQSIDQDGTGEGYDLALIRHVADAVRIPVIACAGVGKYEDFVLGVTEGGAAAVAAANIFHFRELSDRHAKRTMAQAGIRVRS